MSKSPRLPFTHYRTVRQKDGRYAVEITKAGEAVPTTVAGFATEAEADGWATDAQLTEAEHAPLRPLKDPKDPGVR